MKPTWNWKTIAGLVLHILIAGIMILAGSAKLFGLFPPEEVAKLGLSVPIGVIGAGELATACALAGAAHRIAGSPAGQFLLGRRHLPAHGARRTLCASVRAAAYDLAGAYLRVPGMFSSFSVAAPAVPARTDSPRKPSFPDNTSGPAVTPIRHRSPCPG